MKNMGSFKAEGYKLCFNLSFYFCVVCILVPSIIGVFLIDPEKRIARETELFSYIFLLICNLVVGSILASEYSGTLKDRMIAAADRKQIFIAKAGMCLCSVTCIYLFYAVLFVITNDRVSILLLINQYKAILQQTLLLIGMAVIVKSFSALSVVTVVMLCIYKELSNLYLPDSMEYLYNNSYFVQFIRADKLNAADGLFCLAAMGCAVVGYLVFRCQEIK